MGPGRSGGPAGSKRTRLAFFTPKQRVNGSPRWNWRALMLMKRNSGGGPATPAAKESEPRWPELP